MFDSVVKNGLLKNFSNQGMGTQSDSLDSSSSLSTRALILAGALNIDSFFVSGLLRSGPAVVASTRHGVRDVRVHPVVTENAHEHEVHEHHEVTILLLLVLVLLLL